jgi:hypothetical protein
MCQTGEQKSRPCPRCNRQNIPSQFQKAVKSDPILATLGIRFYAGPGRSIDLLVAAQERIARSLIDVFRGTYLKAQPRLRSGQLGRFWFGAAVQDTNAYAFWEVQASRIRPELVSTFSHRDKQVVLVVDQFPRREMEVRDFCFCAVDKTRLHRHAGSAFQ